MPMLTHVVVDNLGEWGQAVGGARGVGDDLVLGLVGVEVDTADEPCTRKPDSASLASHQSSSHGGVSRGSRDDDLLGTALEMSAGLVNGGEDTGRLDDVVGASLAPLDVGRVALAVDDDGLVVDVKLAVLDLDGALEAAVGLYAYQTPHHAARRCLDSPSRT
jgi:hypothetical protein